MSPERHARLTAFCAFCAIACVVFAGVVGSTSLSQQGVVRDNTTRSTVAKSSADSAQTKADTTQKDLGAVRKQAGQADRRSKNTVQFLRGDRGYPGLAGRSGGLGARGPGGARGAQGPGPTDEQVDAAVARRCAVVTCASPPTQAQVLAALRDCAERGECRGPQGDQGDAGRDGKDGADAPPPTDEQLDASTARYCAERNQCSGVMGLPGPIGLVGEPGPAGPQGPEGPPGPAPAGVQTVRPDGNGGVEVCVATDPDGDLIYTCP